MTPKTGAALAARIAQVEAIIAREAALHADRTSRGWFSHHEMNRQSYIAMLGRLKARQAAEGRAA